MKFSPTLKGKLKKSTLQVSPFQMDQDVGSVSMLTLEIRLLREDLLATANRELDKVDEKIAELDAKVEYALQLEKGEKGEDADEQKIADWVLSQIRQPKDGVSPDPEEVINEVLSRLPKLPNKEQIVAEVLKQLPTPKASLKIIKEELNLDKEALLDEILKDPKLKVKFDGLDAQLKVLDRRYIHGGGDTVSAGSGITITNVNGTKQISATGSGSFSVLAATGDIDDTNTTFTFTSAPTIVVINGASYLETSNVGGSPAWSIVGTTVTLAFPVGVGGSIFGIL